MRMKIKSSLRLRTSLLMISETICNIKTWARGHKVRLSTELQPLKWLPKAEQCRPRCSGAEGILSFYQQVPRKHQRMGTVLPRRAAWRKPTRDGKCHYGQQKAGTTLRWEETRKGWGKNHTVRVLKGTRRKCAPFHHYFLVFQNHVFTERKGIIYAYISKKNK